MRRGFLVCVVLMIHLSQEEYFFYNGHVKKFLVLIFCILLSLSLSAALLPSYDFTFYATADGTLTSFTKENVGIDITGYGFVGSRSTRGIYIRIGVQTPFDTLLKLKDSLFPSKDNSVKKTDDSTPVIPEASFSDTSDTATANIEMNSSVQDGARNVTKKEKIDPSKWKFLLTLGPAWRNMMDTNAMVYAGLGFSVSTDYINDFTYENGDYYSSFSAVIGTDLDAGFRIGLSGSKTTIRIGVHFITDLIGFSSLKVYDRDRIVISTENSIYGYIAGEKGVASATVGRGYIRLAKTINEKKKVRYNYSNRTEKVGGGRTETIIL